MKLDGKQELNVIKVKVIICNVYQLGYFFLLVINISNVLYKCCLE